MLGVRVAASTVWEILKDAGVDPAGFDPSPDRAATEWAAFLRGQAEVILACDFIEAMTLSGQRQHGLAVIEHATRRVRILGTTAHPTASWVAQTAQILVMDLEDAGAAVTEKGAHRVHGQALEEATVTGAVAVFNPRAGTACRTQRELRRPASGALRHKTCVAH